MTIDEKLRHFYEVSMESAKDEAAKAIEEYRASLNSQLEEHKAQKQAAAENQLKIQSENSAREINKALSSEHLHIKRQLSKKQQELQDKLFQEVEDMLTEFVAGPSYGDWLERMVRKALAIAQEDPVQIYLSASDERFSEELKRRTGITPLISPNTFIGGIKAVIPQKNILIDHTILSMLESERENFNFDGGLTNEQ